MRHRNIAVTIVAAAAAVSLAAACVGERARERRDFVALKEAMMRLTRAPDDALEEQLGKLEALDLRTERVRAVRADCCRAYRTFVLAAKKSREADALIDGIEKGGAAQGEGFAEQKKRAEELLAGSNALLEQTVALKKTCHGALAALEKEHPY